MIGNATSRRIAISGSASVGKTSLVSALARSLGLNMLKEEMREYLESNRTDLSEQAPAQVADVLIRLWRKRQEQEVKARSFVADNCSLDFAAYALYYGCVDAENASILLSETAKQVAQYDAIFVLPWGVLPYSHDGIRTPNQYLQFRYQLIIEGLLRRHVDPARLHYIPETIVDLEERCQWVISKLEQTKQVGGRPENASDSILGNKTQSTDERGRKGFVYLVGGGPGDPRLLTVRALELLQKADVVAHDLLISPAVLAEVPATAQLVPVGRRHGGVKTDYRLHPDVLAHARAGKMVVRLKCGDPLVFGRGGEEAEELTEAGIPFEIVPGITAALGAAAYAGIPLTHRQYASEVTFSTGHDAADSVKSSERPNPGGTVVLFMVARRLQANLDRLIRSGYSADTPAAYIAGATTPTQQVILGTLATLSSKIDGMNPETPALVIVGEVVALRKRISWFDKNWPEAWPLQGSRILLARARPGASVISEHLRSLGAVVVEAPQISIEPLEDYSSLEDAMNRLHEFEAVLFGCAEAVVPVLARTRSQRHLLRTVAIGDRAAAALADAGITPMLAIPGACSEALQKHSGAFGGKRFLLLTSDQGRPALQKELAKLEASVQGIPVYRILHDFAVPVANALDFDLVVLPSSSAAKLLLRSAVGDRLKAVPMIAMGPETEAAARACGVREIFQSQEDTVESLVSCVIQRHANKPAPFESPICHHVLVEAGNRE
jgi:uroporphyrinogen III methyltransferase/synthase